MSNGEESITSTNTAFHCITLQSQGIHPQYSTCRRLKTNLHSLHEEQATIAVVTNTNINLCALKSCAN